MHQNNSNKGKRNFNTLLRYQEINFRIRRLSTLKGEGETEITDIFNQGGNLTEILKKTDTQPDGAAPHSFRPEAAYAQQKKIINILDITRIQTNIIFDNYNPHSGEITPKFYSDAENFLSTRKPVNERSAAPHLWMRSHSPKVGTGGGEGVKSQLEKYEINGKIQ